MSAHLAPHGEEHVEGGGLAKGVAVAIVTNNKDDAHQGRVRLTYPWKPKQESDWARIATPMAGPSRGLYLLPEVGDEVLVAFDRGDLRRPYVLGALWNGKEPPPARNSDGANRLRVLRTKHGHELRFDDGEKHAVELSTKGGRKLVLDDDKIELTDASGNRLTIDSSGALTIKSNQSIKLESAQIEIAASASLTLKASGTVTIEGALVRIN